MIPASAQGATKLLEALEKLSQWAGEPSGGGPSGAPSRELVRAFEEALSTAPPEGPAAAAGEGGPTASSAAALLPGPAEAMPCPPVDGAGAEGSLAVEQSGNPLAVEQPAAAGGADVPAGQEVTEPQAVFQSEGISRQDVLEELGQLLERVSAQGAAISPQELLHVQQLVGMLNVQAKVGVQTSPQTTQGLEGLLRQSHALFAASPAAAPFRL